MSYVEHMMEETDLLTRCQNSVTNMVLVVDIKYVWLYLVFDRQLTFL